MIMETQIREINTVTEIVFESCFKLLQHNIIAQIILFIKLYLIKIYCTLILLQIGRKFVALTVKYQDDKWMSVKYQKDILKNVVQLGQSQS